MHIRHLHPTDIEMILPVMNQWWGGREMTHLLPRYLFDHFHNTSYVIEYNNRLVGFIIGFLSQTEQQTAYIHLVGVDPAHRRKGIAQELYDKFFLQMNTCGIKEVRCITSPINKKSISYHTALGFNIVPGDKSLDGVPVHSNYDGKGNERVLFRKALF